MKQCTTCGFSVDDTISFCPECGANLQNTQPQQTNKDFQPTENESLRARFITENNTQLPNQSSSPENSNQYRTDYEQNAYNLGDNTVHQQPITPYPNVPNQQSDKQKVNVGMAILSYFIPLVGWIYWGVKKEENPKSARTCGIVACVSAAINVLIVILSMVVTGIAFKGATDIIKDADWDFDSDSDYSYSIEDNNSDDSILFEDEETTAKENNVETTAPNSETTSSKKNTTSTVSNNWEDYTVIINGTKITLPCSWADFNSKTGFNFKDSDDATTTLKSNQYTISTPIKKGEHQINVRFINTSGAQKTLAECQVAGINVDAFYEPTADVVFAGGLKIGDKADAASIKKLFGEPTRVYDSDNSDYHTYTYEAKDSYYNEIEIIVKDGKINKISLEHFDF